MSDFDKFSAPGSSKTQRDIISAGPRIVEDTSSVDFVAQVALAGVLRQPTRGLITQVLDLCGDRDQEFQIGVVQRARELIEHIIGTDLRAGIRNESLPILVDRLSFSWRLMQQADTAVWKPKKSDVPTPTTLVYAHALFAPLLPGGMRVPLVQALLELLRLGTDARFLRAYYRFRRAKSPNSADLAPPLSSASRTGNQEDLRRVIWWCLRARREKYVDIPASGPVRIEFGYLVEAVLEDLAEWLGTEGGADTLAPDVEVEVNQWLTYSCLQDSADLALSSGEVDRDIARAFLKHNELKTKLKIWSRPGPSNIGRTEELETQLRQYVAENQLLEERLKTLQETKAPQASSAQSGSVDDARLTEVLKTIDAKYAFDTLNAVQLGDETHLTLRSFVSHLFYSLRKQGFAEYPDQASFNLTYDDSGLYDCDGFEVALGETVPVRVIRKGWALRTKGKLSPVRRARVSKASHASGEHA